MFCSIKLASELHEGSLPPESAEELITSPTKKIDEIKQSKTLMKQLNYS